MQEALKTTKERLQNLQKQEYNLAMQLDELRYVIGGYVAKIQQIEEQEAEEKEEAKEEDK